MTTTPLSKHYLLVSFDRTASQKIVTHLQMKSIWSLVDESTFHSRVHELHDRGHTADTRSGPASTDTSDARYLLSPTSEQRLATDIAFLAACQPAGEHVVAATIQATQERREIKISLAANRGIVEDVEIGMKSLLKCLERRARKEISRETCLQDAFDIIIRLNRNRILGRLRSKKFSIPSGWAPASKKPLTVRWQKHIDKQLQNTRRSRSEPVKALALEMEALHLLFLRIEDDISDNTIPHIKAIVKYAYELAWGGKDPLADRLTSLNFPISFIDRRDVRELYKVAKYWLICRSLEEYCSSRSYGTKFQSLELQVIRPQTAFIPNSVGESGLSIHIHAEIQMIVHYELSEPERTWPQIIGTSKDACFLCHTFIEAHGAFRAYKTHGLTFWQWTVPDLEEYSAKTMQRFRTALEQLDLAVKDEHKREHFLQKKEQDPAHSSVSLSLPRPLTPDSVGSALSRRNSSASCVLH